MPAEKIMEIKSEALAPDKFTRDAALLTGGFLTVLAIRELIRGDIDQAKLEFLGAGGAFACGLAEGKGCTLGELVMDYASSGVSILQRNFPVLLKKALR